MVTKIVSTPKPKNTSSAPTNTAPAPSAANNYNQTVMSTYSSMLGRTPSAEEVNYWVGQMNGGMTAAQLAANFKGSQEYINIQKAPATVVPGQALGNKQINVADYAGQAATDPRSVMPTGTTLSGNVPQINPNAAGTNINQQNPMAPKSYTAATATADTAANVAPKSAASYQAATTANQVNDAAMTAAQGQVDPRAIIDAPQIDLNATANGQNAVGAALMDSAQQDLNTVDPKATLRGQLQLLQTDFVDPNTGEPRIPAWAAGAARNVEKIAAFKGMTGTAATAAMATALHEASIVIADKDATFYQTLTMQNLSNKQAATINRATVLAQMDLANLDSRLSAAIQNSKNFMDMDLANLNNEQQARVVNTQARVQSILADANAVNTARMFNAQSENDMNKFYDELNSSIDMYNTSQVNSMSQFNATQKNSASQFNLQLENNREQFYRSMQYNIDVANANWRQTVTLQNNQNAFEAAALDVKNTLGISQEALNRLWDRSDSLLDYVWQSGEKQLDRDAAMVLQKLQAKTSERNATTSGIGTVLGSIAGPAFAKIFG